MRLCSNASRMLPLSTKVNIKTRVCHLHKFWSSLNHRIFAFFFLFFAVAAIAQPVPPELVNGLKWRLIGPFRGGRVVAVAGVPGDSTTFYFGSVNGGIWKTTDAGVVWSPIFDGQPVGSIGALAVAPSDPKVIYAGTGETDIREDLSSGNGVYKSVDGGAHWARVLGLGPEIGISDLAMCASTPQLLFAGAWHTRRPPWSAYAPVDGPGGGLYRSQDAGKTWSRLLGNGNGGNGNGLPEGDWGRVGVAVASEGKRVYALIEVKKPQTKKSGLYRSDDGGNTWVLANADPRLTSRAWYFNR